VQTSVVLILQLTTKCLNEVHFDGYQAIHAKQKSSVDTFSLVLNKKIPAADLRLIKSSYSNNENVNVGVTEININ